METESAVSSPECLSSLPVLCSLEAQFVSAQHEIAPCFLMVLVGSCRFGSGFVLRGLHT